MTRLVELESMKFVRFLSDLRTQQNWQMNAQLRSEGRYLVQGQRGDGMKGLMFVFPTVETTVGTEHIKGFVVHTKEHGVDTVVAATQGEFADAVHGFTTNHDVTLSDHDELGRTVTDEGLKQTTKQYTDSGVFGTAEVEFGLSFDLSESVGDALAPLPIVAAREWLAGLIDGRGDAGGDDGDNGGDSGDGGDGDPSMGSPRDRLPSSVDDLKSGSPPSIRVVVVAILLLVLTLDSVVVLGSMLDGLSGPNDGGPGDDRGVSVSALSSVSVGSVDVIVRWSARTTGTFRAGNQTYAPPKGERFVVVGFDATTTDDSPESLSQSVPVFESGDIRCGHQPPSNAIGFDNDGLFALGDDTYIWTVFTIPTNTTAETVLVQSINEGTVAFAHDDTVSIDPSGDD